MELFENKGNCTGCGACAAICPSQCISMVEDKEGFNYPTIEQSMCKNCGLCKVVCHMQHSSKGGNEPYFYAACLKDKEALYEVSSGGVSWALMQIVLKQGGVVYGAIQKEIGKVCHERAENIDEAKMFRRSKYLQSYTANVFISVKNDLEMGTVVLFTGTACQIAALKSFLHKDYANLYTVDVVCHGVPSNLAFRKYKEELEKKVGASIIDLNCRNKDKGWKANQYEITFDNGFCITELSSQNAFHAGYLEGLFYRPSCNECKYAVLPRTSDMTLADFWKYEGNLSTEPHNMGISLVVCSSEKGIELLNISKELLYIEKTTKEAALSSCRHLCNTPIASKKRDSFLQALSQKSYNSSYKKYTKNRLRNRIIRKIKQLIKIKI